MSITLIDCADRASSFRRPRRRLELWPIVPSPFSRQSQKSSSLSTTASKPRGGPLLVAPHNIHNAAGSRRPHPHGWPGTSILDRPRAGVQARRDRSIGTAPCCWCFESIVVCGGHKHDERGDGSRSTHTIAYAPGYSYADHHHHHHHYHDKVWAAAAAPSLETRARTHEEERRGGRGIARRACVPCHIIGARAAAVAAAAVVAAAAAAAH